MTRVGTILMRLTAALSLVLVFSVASYATTPKVDPVSPCTDPGANFSVAIGFDSTNNLPTVSATKNTYCVGGGNTVAFAINPNANISQWDVKFPTTNPLFAGTCAFGTPTTSPSQSCTVIPSPSAGDYLYEVDVWVNGTEYSLDPKVIIKPSGMKHHRRHHPHPTPSSENP